MNSLATSVMAWRLHRSAIAACLVYFREIDPTALWEFCNTIPLMNGHNATRTLLRKRMPFPDVRAAVDSAGSHLKMDVCYFRKSRSTFYETHDGGRRPPTVEATCVAQEESRHFKVQSQV